MSMDKKTVPVQRVALNIPTRQRLKIAAQNLSKGRWDMELTVEDLDELKKSVDPKLPVYFEDEDGNIYGLRTADMGTAVDVCGRTLHMAETWEGPCADDCAGFIVHLVKL